MITADELFFKGRLLSFKDAGGGSVAGQKTTLRYELLAMMTPPMFRSGRTRLQYGLLTLKGSCNEHFKYVHFV
ncbi:hypothetical protein R6Q57_005196 [Mikania cordata]